MKRNFFATLALFILVLIGAFSPVFGFLLTGTEPRAYAQLGGVASPSGTFNNDGGTGTTYAGPGGGPNGENAETNPSETSKASTVSTSLDCTNNFLCSLVTGYVAVANFLPHLFAELSGLTLDWVVWKNVQSETWTSQDTVDSFVVKGWKLVRDLSNLFFIFALFLVAFSLILNGLESESRGPLLGLDPKRTIAQVILMALLINFSFFMCRVVIDTSNLFARVFYNKITVVETTSSNNGQSVGSDTHKISMGSSSEFLNTTNFAGIRSISLGILSKINPQELVLKNSDVAGKKEGNWVFSYYSYDMGVYVLLLFVASIVGLFNIFLIYLFASSAMFLIARIYGLFFLVILSPIAFISTAIPGLKTKEYFGFDDWFKQLTGLAFSLPIYLFFIYLGISFIDAGSNIKVNTVTGYIGISALIIVKLVSMGAVLIIGKKVAKDLSGRFGAMASNAITGIVTGAAMVAGAAMTGGASAALRMGGQVTRRGALTAARGIGGAIVGDERAQAWEQKLRSANGGGLKRLNNFNPLRDMKGKSLDQKAGQYFRNFGAATAEMARTMGSAGPDTITNGFNTGGRYGTLSQIQSINKKLIEANKKFYDPNTTPAEKAELRREIDALEAEKAKYSSNRPPAPGSTLSNSTPPNAGTSGNNAANSGNNQPPNNGGQATNNTGNANAGNRGTGGGNNGNPGNGNPTGNPGPNNGGGPQPGNSGGGAGAAGGRGTGATGGNFNGANGSSGNNNSGNSNGSGTTSNASAAPSPHELLGVDKNATWEEVKSAYRKKTKEMHPDKGGDEEAYRIIKDAYEKLAKDPRYADKTTTRSTSSNNTSSNSTGSANSNSNSSGSAAQQPAARTMNLLSGINSYNTATFAPRNTTQPVGQMSLRQNTAIPKPQGGTGALALGMGSNTAPAAIALNPTSGSTASGISLSQGGTATPLAPVTRQFGDSKGPKPTYTPVQEDRFKRKAENAIARNTEVSTGIERKQEAQQSVTQITPQKTSTVVAPVTNTSASVSTIPVPEKKEPLPQKIEVPEKEAIVVPVPPSNQVIKNRDVQAQKIIADQDKIVEKNIDKELTSMQQTSLYAGTENLKDSIKKAAGTFRNGDPRFAVISDETGQKLNTAANHLENFLSTVKEGNVDTQPLHEALNYVSQALQESTNGRRPRGIDSEHLENEHRAISNLHRDLEENLNRISASLPEKDKQGILQKSDQVLTNSYSVKDFLQRKKNILDNY